MAWEASAAAGSEIAGPAGARVPAPASASPAMASEAQGGRAGGRGVPAVGMVVRAVSPS